METTTRRPDGFRERGQQVTRLEAFIDAAFAFAVTLLVISLDAIPNSAAALIEAVKGIPAFGASFALIALFWNAHHTWSRRYGLNDRATVLLGLVLVFQVLVYVYPLKMLFGSLFSWLSDGALPAGFVIRAPTDLRTMFAIYAIAWTTLGCTVVALYAHAWRRREVVGLDLEERVGTRVELAVWCLAPVTGLIALAACILIDWHGSNPWRHVLFPLPGVVYALMALSYPLAVWVERRVRPAIEAELAHAARPSAALPPSRRARRRHRLRPRPSE